ncbi:hypothetical protein D3C77_616980 [compost metagenome]
MAHVIIKHHRHGLGQMATGAEQQGLLARTLHRIDRLEPLPIETAAQGFVEAQFETGIQRFAGLFRPLLQ